MQLKINFYCQGGAKFCAQRTTSRIIVPLLNFTSWFRKKKLTFVYQITDKKPKSAPSKDAESDSEDHPTKDVEEQTEVCYSHIYQIDYFSTNNHGLLILGCVCVGGGGKGVLLFSFEILSIYLQVIFKIWAHFYSKYFKQLTLKKNCNFSLMIHNCPCPLKSWSPNCSLEKEPEINPDNDILVDYQAPQQEKSIFQNK